MHSQTVNHLTPLACQNRALDHFNNQHSVTNSLVPTETPTAASVFAIIAECQLCSVLKNLESLTSSGGPSTHPSRPAPLSSGGTTGNSNKGQACSSQHKCFNLTVKEIQDRKARGFCFQCNEKFTSGLSISSP